MMGVVDEEVRKEMRGWEGLLYLPGRPTEADREKHPAVSLKAIDPRLSVGTCECFSCDRQL